MPDTFSRGLRQKAAIALAFVRPFELLLVDEPFVGLDEAGKAALLALFDEPHDDGATLLVATHELGFVHRVDRLIALQRRRAALRRSARRHRRAPPGVPDLTAPLSRRGVVTLTAGIPSRSMQEFTTVSSSSYDPSALAAKLTEKSAEGWAVVGIVSTGGDVTAFLSRESTGQRRGRARVGRTDGDVANRLPGPTR